MGGQPIDEVCLCRLFGTGSTYEGDFLAGEITGIGRRQYPNGSVGYDLRRLRQRHMPKNYGSHPVLRLLCVCFAAAATAVAQVYEGEHFRGERHGEGRLLYPDGSVYSGGWREQRRSGRGALAMEESGDAYEGFFEDHHFSGPGVYRSADGAVFEGDFRKVARVAVARRAK